VTEAAGAPPVHPAAAGSRVVRLALPLGAGAVSVFGFAPFYAWFVPILAVAALFFAWQRSATPGQAAAAGFAFGLGFFGAGVSWVYVSLHVFGSMPMLLAALATFLFCAYLALFPAAAGWLVLRATPLAGSPRLVASAAAIALAEWLRGWLFTGFPWLNLGTSQAPSGPLVGLAPYVGNYGVTLAVAAAAALLVPLAGRRLAWPRLAAFAALLGGSFALGQVEWTRPAGPAVTVALLQGNVPQELKWREEVRTRTLLDYREMIFQAKARVVVIPETALPAFLDQLPPDYLESIRAHAKAEGKEVLLGVVEREFRDGGYDYYNSLVNLTAAGAWRKVHLVPFGEFIPPGFRFVLAVLKIPMSDFARGAPGQQPLAAAGTRFGVMICYEDIFGEEVIRQLPAAQVLVNVSNDAWFGKSFAAEQHLQSSQMRAIEAGRPVIRSTNTGATAAIDARGRVSARLEWFSRGTLTTDVVPMEGMTPYAHAGNVPAVLLALGAFLVAWRRGRRATGPR
jgi:apolipoprotein N-acyltransferase